MTRRTARSRAHNKGKVLRKYLTHSTYEHPFEHKAAIYQTLFVFTLTVAACLGAAAYGRLNEPQELISPIPVHAYTETKVVEKEVIIDKNENVDTWIGDAVDEFLPNHKSEARMIMHCLAHREAGHRGTGPDDPHGDGGRAGGGMQFHEATWNRMRKQMIAQGHAAEIGSRYDYKEAIRTTAWAIANGRALEWGPILRDSKGSRFAACQVPSWYK